MTFTRRSALKNLSMGGASLAMAPFIQSLQAHAAGREEGLPKRFVFVVKSSGVEKFNLVPEGIENHFLGDDGEKLGNKGRKPGEAINVSLKDH
ncbi:twin-arginine translocation signal domain-containing protein, partial [Akkermansiaceae bacterium]|nr:twin-arginine translocation signal domain-containing protein [Akkermansiaceae bacterium]